MAKLEFQQIYLRLGQEINFLSQSSLINYKNEVKSDALDVINEMKPTIEGWIKKLNAKEMSCADLVCKLQSEKETMKLSNLKNSGLSDADLGIASSMITQIIANSIANAYLSSLFENQTISRNFSRTKSYSEFID